MLVEVDIEVTTVNGWLVRPHRCLGSSPKYHLIEPDFFPIIRTQLASLGKLNQTNRYMSGPLTPTNIQNFRREAKIF